MGLLTPEPAGRQASLPEPIQAACRHHAGRSTETALVFAGTKSSRQAAAHAPTQRWQASTIQPTEADVVHPHWWPTGKRPTDRRPRRRAGNAANWPTEPVDQQQHQATVHALNTAQTYNVELRTRLAKAPACPAAAGSASSHWRHGWRQRQREHQPTAHASSSSLGLGLGLGLGLRRWGHQAFGRLCLRGKLLQHNFGLRSRRVEHHVVTCLQSVDHHTLQR